MEKGERSQATLNSSPTGAKSMLQRVATSKAAVPYRSAKYSGNVFLVGKNIDNKK